MRIPELKNRCFAAQTFTAVAIAAVLIFGCRTRAYNSAPLAGDAKKVPAHLIYTFSSEGDSASEYVAFGRANFKRLALRTTGTFLKQQLSGPSATNGWMSDLDANSTMQSSCSKGICSYKAVFPSGFGNGRELACAGDGIALETFGQKIQLRCNNDMNLNLVAPRESTKSLASRASQKFEFIRIGHPLKPSQAAVPKVDTSAPLKFRISPTLLANAKFTESFRTALNYWNSAAGLKLFETTFEESNLPQDFTTSAVFAKDLGNKALALARHFSDGKTGEILAIHILINRDFVSKENYEFDMTNTLIHELGHGLSLAHNFAGSADPLAADSGGSTTFMDYIAPHAPQLPTATPLPYDAAAMRYLYQGENPTQEFLHCNDVQSTYLPYCQRDDISIESPSEILKGLAAQNEVDLAWRIAEVSTLISKEILDAANAGDVTAHFAIMEQWSSHDRLLSVPPFSISYKQIWFGNGNKPSEVEALKAKWLAIITRARKNASSDPRYADFPTHAQVLDWMESLLRKPIRLAKPLANEARDSD